MKCEICHKNDAQTVLHRKENGVDRELYVCSECAARESRPRRPAPRGARPRGKPDVSVTISGPGDKPPPFIEALLSATADIVNQIAEEEEENLVCKTCGTKWSDVEETGLLGCPDCWGTFVGKLSARLEAEQRRIAHVGRSPSGATHERRFLEHKLRDAIRREDYKAAAKLRDQLNALDSGAEDGGA